MRRRVLCCFLALALLASCAAPAGESPAPSLTAETGSPAPTETPEPEAGVTADAIAQAIVASQPEGEGYMARVDKEAPDGGDPAFYLELYGVDGDIVGDSAVYTVDGVDAREIAVFSLDHGTYAYDTASTVEALEAYRQSRRGDFYGYAPDQADLVERGEALSEGSWVALLICADMAAAREAFERTAGQGEPAPAPTPGETPSPAPVVIEDMDQLADSYARVILDSQEDGEDYLALPEKDREFYLTQVYGIPADSWGGAAIYTAGGTDAREIVVLSGMDSGKSYGAAKALETYRQNRAADFARYLPDQAALVEKGKVMEGNLAVLLICADPEGAEKAMAEELSHLVIEPFDPDGEPPETYDWTGEVNEKGWKRFDPPGEFDMTPYDTSAILTAWETGEESGLSEKDAAILAKCREALEAAVKPGMTDFQKELNLHDWLVQSYYGHYDRTVHDRRTPQGREDNLNPYGLLVRGYGICLSYATTFQLLMDLAGVECITVVGASSSSSSDHAWNMVKLEGEWYCVDPTWDATYKEGLTQETMWPWQHRYFNVTSDRMRETDHQWDYANTPEATATRFRWDGAGELPA